MKIKNLYRYVVELQSNVFHQWLVNSPASELRALTLSAVFVTTGAS